MTGDPFTLRQIRQCLAADFDLLACHDPRQALSFLNAHTDVRLVIADDLIGWGDAASQVMEAARARQPGAVRVLLSNPGGELMRVVRALHSGLAHRSAQKPINCRELLAAASDARVPFV